MPPSKSSDSTTNAIPILEHAAGLFAPPTSDDAGFIPVPEEKTNLPGSVSTSESHEGAHVTSAERVETPKSPSPKPKSGVLSVSSTQAGITCAGEQVVQTTTVGDDYGALNPAEAEENGEVAQEDRNQKPMTPEPRPPARASGMTQPSTPCHSARPEELVPNFASLPPASTIQQKERVQLPIRAAATSFDSPPPSPPKVGKGKRRRRSTDSPRTSPPPFAESTADGHPHKIPTPPLPKPELLDADAVDFRPLEDEVVLPQPMKVLGCGAFGVVVLGQTVSEPSRTVAVKYIPLVKEGSKDFTIQRDAIKREVAALKRLNRTRTVEETSLHGHPNVAEFIDFFEGEVAACESFVITS